MDVGSKKIESFGVKSWGWQMNGDTKWCFGLIIILVK